MSTGNVPGKEAGERYVFVDALRGVAAVAVVICHLFYHRWLFKSIEAGLFKTIADAMHYGARGVQIFFVISGFVIAHSLRRTTPNGSGLGNFILRRQLRLDLPYWGVIALILLQATIERQFHFIRHPGAIPSPGDLLLNMTYLHLIFRRVPVLDVGWTLCIEIQFYLFFIFALAVTTRRAMATGISKATLGAIFVTGVVCLAFNPAPGMVQPWMIHYWPYFCAGILAYWSVQRWISLWVLPAFCVPFAIALLWSDLPSCTVTGIITAGALYILGLRGKLTTLWNGRVVQYLGRISYSLYLVHVPVIFLICRIGYQKLADNQRSAALCFTVAGLACLPAAHLFHRWIEEPSVRLAARLKRKRPITVPEVTVPKVAVPEVAVLEVLPIAIAPEGGLL
jgi:peptidoglycan/LPS O-acetylase OafA/YrhL